MTAALALEQLNALIATYQTLTEREKFGLAKVFQEATGGKLSPFNSPSPVSVGVVPVAGPNGEIGFLGVRRAIPPCVGEVALAGGFLGTSEDPVAGMVREVLEETGIAIDPSSVGEAAVVKMGHGNNMLMFFQSRDVLDYATLERASAHLSEDTDGEASELVFITPQTALCFPLHQQAVNAAFVAYGVAPATEPAKTFKP